jgi:hypothetical protein
MTAIAAQPVPADAVQPDLDVQSAVVLRIVDESTFIDLVVCAGRSGYRPGTKRLEHPSMQPLTNRQVRPNLTGRTVNDSR